MVIITVRNRNGKNLTNCVAFLARFQTCPNQEIVENFIQNRPQRVLHRKKTPEKPTIKKL
jgi:hypothetical protein